MALNFNPMSFDKEDAERISNLIDLAEADGRDLMKVVTFKERSPFKTHIVDTLVRANVSGTYNSYETSAVLTKEPLRMYKEKSGFCVGFVVNTPSNLIRMADLIATGVCRPVSNDVLEKVQAAAKKANRSCVKRTFADDFVDVKAGSAADLLKIKDLDKERIRLERELEKVNLERDRTAGIEIENRRLAKELAELRAKSSPSEEDLITEDENGDIVTGEDAQDIFSEQEESSDGAPVIVRRGRRRS